MHQRSLHSFRTRKAACAHITLWVPPQAHRHLGAFLHLGKFMVKCHAGAEPPGLLRRCSDCRLLAMGRPSWDFLHQGDDPCPDGDLCWLPSLGLGTNVFHSTCGSLALHYMSSLIVEENRGQRLSFSSLRFFPAVLWNPTPQMLNLALGIVPSLPE